MAETPSLCQRTCEPRYLTAESRSSSGGTGLLQQSPTLLLLTSAQRPGETRALCPVAWTRSELSQAALALVPGPGGGGCAPRSSMPLPYLHSSVNWLLLSSLTRPVPVPSCCALPQPPQPLRLVEITFNRELMSSSRSRRGASAWGQGTTPAHPARAPRPVPVSPHAALQHGP